MLVNSQAVAAVITDQHISQNSLMSLVELFAIEDWHDIKQRSAEPREVPRCIDSNVTGI